jgi:hypothetical protein
MGSAEESAKSDCDGLANRLSFIQDEIVSSVKKMTRGKDKKYSWIANLNISLFIFMYIENCGTKPQGC